MYIACDASLYAFVTSRVQSIDLHNSILRECDEVPIGEHFVSTQGSLQLILIDVDLTKLTSKGSVPPKTIHYLTV